MMASSNPRPGLVRICIRDSDNEVNMTLYVHGSFVYIFSFVYM